MSAFQKKGENGKNKKKIQSLVSWMMKLMLLLCHTIECQPCSNCGLLIQEWSKRSTTTAPLNGTSPVGKIQQHNSRAESAKTPTSSTGWRWRKQTAASHEWTKFRTTSRNIPSFSFSTDEQVSPIDKSARQKKKLSHLFISIWKWYKMTHLPNLFLTR